MAVDRAERLTNLLALLLSTQVPLTFDDIENRLEGQYPSGSAARRQAFERDKATLRDLGVPIDTEVMGGTDAGRTGYRIDRDRYELADLDLRPDEQRALQLAVAAVRSGTPMGTDALLKLGAGGTDDDAAVSANVPVLEALPALREAVANGSPVTFTYRDAVRHLDPWGLALRDGFWYVVGHDHDRGERRTFRVDRIEGDVEPLPGRFERPAVDLVSLLPDDPKLFGALGPPPEAIVAIDASTRVGRSALAELGDDRVVARRDDGWVEAAVPCANVGAFGSWVLGLMDAAEVISPDDVREEIWRRLTEPAGIDVDEATRLASTQLGVRAASRRGDGVSAASRRRADQRVKRALVMIPWLAERGAVALADVADRFDLSPDEVEADIAWVSMCGLPPYVDEMIDVYVDEGMVHLGVPRLFTRPLRLTAPEGFALLTAGRAAMALPGADHEGPLGRGLAKLAAALGDEAGTVVVDLARPDHADDLADAVRRVERLELEYWSAADDEPTRRAVTPRRLFADRGNWYLRGDDDRSGESRTFRLDRIESYLRLGEFDDADDTSPADEEWFADAAIERATLALRPRGYWVAERYPVDDVAEVTLGGDDVRLVRLAVTGDRWLARLMVRLGPDAAVVEPSSWRDVGDAARARIAAIYA